MTAGHDTTLTDLQQYIANALGQAVQRSEIARGELVFIIHRERIHDVLKFLKDDVNCQFKQLVDICGADYPDRAERFEVVYNLLSLTHNYRVRIKLSVGEEAAVNSVADIYSTANWFEREVWDMFGIYFNDHPDLRRILTDYGFDGHPLRKDFPLTGYVELRYDETQKRVVYEPVQLTQEFRSFDFSSPWEGMTEVQLPGDEKAVNPEAILQKKKTGAA